MKVTLIQLDIEWGSPAENIKRAERLMAQEPDSDLYVLPEMWSTGFATEPSGIAEDEATSISLEWMKNTAREHQCAISGSLAVRVDETYRNRHYFVNGKTGIVSHYDKHHLFRYGGEDNYYVAGEEHTIVEFMDFRFLLLTCYDLRFPIWSRYADTLQYHAIIAVANWPESRQNAWQILTRARAMENQAFLIGCNRVGDDDYSHYRGQSSIISPIGLTLVSCHANCEETASFLLNLEMLDHQRTKFRVLEDRDIR
ncbi:MAG: nitrilase family protein [Prevotella sp.]|nr:nitrilase family protein [Prevotella sp.]